MPYFDRIVDVPDDDYPQGRATFFVDAEEVDADESGPAAWVIYELRLYTLDNGDAAMVAQRYGAQFVRSLEAAALEEYDGEGY